MDSKPQRYSNSGGRREETNINEKIGQKNKAQLRVKNPQIINGGQTSFTLSRIYRENVDAADDVFRDKEVLLKIITLLGDGSKSGKLDLIDEISNATNKQTPVINADKFANETVHVDLQHKVFERYGLLYERKRGEFSDGIQDGYITYGDIVERNHFWRLLYAANGKINRGFQKKLFQRNEFSDILPASDALLDRLFLAVNVFRHLKKELKPGARVERDLYAKVFAYIELYGDDSSIESATIEQNLLVLNDKWGAFVKEQREREQGPGRRTYVDKLTGQSKSTFSLTKYFKSAQFERDLVTYFAGNVARVGG